MNLTCWFYGHTATKPDMLVSRFTDLAYCRNEKACADRRADNLVDRCRDILTEAVAPAAPRRSLHTLDRVHADREHAVAQRGLDS